MIHPQEWLLLRIIKCRHLRYAVLQHPRVLIYVGIVVVAVMIPVVIVIVPVRTATLGRSPPIAVILEIVSGVIILVSTYPARMTRPVTPIFVVSGVEIIASRVPIVMYSADIILTIAIRLSTAADVDSSNGIRVSFAFARRGHRGSEIGRRH
jgi:hypothetical protein